MFTPFYNDQSHITNSEHLPFLQKKFGLTEAELNRRKEWIDMGYFKRTYGVLFSEVEQTKKSILHIEKLLNTFTHSKSLDLRIHLTRTEYCKYAQQSIESCLIACKSGFFVREVDQHAFNRLLERVSELLKDLDCI